MVGFPGLVCPANRTYYTALERTAATFGPAPSGSRLSVVVVVLDTAVVAVVVCSPVSESRTDYTTTEMLAWNNYVYKKQHDSLLDFHLNFYLCVH